MPTAAHGRGEGVGEFYLTPWPPLLAGEGEYHTSGFELFHFFRGAFPIWCCYLARGVTGICSCYVSLMGAGERRRADTPVRPYRADDGNSGKGVPGCTCVPLTG